MFVFGVCCGGMGGDPVWIVEFGVEVEYGVVLWLDLVGCFVVWVFYGDCLVCGYSCFLLRCYCVWVMVGLELYCDVFL